jgi:hypothetical protein
VVVVLSKVRRLVLVVLVVVHQIAVEVKLLGRELLVKDLMAALEQLKPPGVVVVLVLLG